MTAARAAALALLACAAPAAAANFDIEATTDLRRRGLSRSDAQPTLVVRGTVPLGGGFSLDAAVAGLRGSSRHGGADMLGEAALRYERQADSWTLWGDIQGLGFAGADGQNYAQMRAGSALGVGPAQLSVQLAWAPPQAAIGGSNLYVDASARAGLTGTPVTLTAGIGRSLGSDDGSGRARRLRPCGDYTDFRLEADHVRGALTLGASITATTIGSGCSTARGTAHDGGARLLLRASIGF